MKKPVKKSNSMPMPMPPTMPAGPAMACAGSAPGGMGVKKGGMVKKDMTKDMDMDAKKKGGMCKKNGGVVDAGSGSGVGRLEKAKK